MICDLAETYGVIDYKSLPPHTVATLVSGLRENSRLIMERSNLLATTEVVLLGYIADKISNLVWMISEDGKKNRNQPAKILPILTGQERPREKVTGYRTAEEFERALKRVGGQ